MATTTVNELGEIYVVTELVPDTYYSRQGWGGMYRPYENFDCERKKPLMTTGFVTLESAEKEMRKRMSEWIRDYPDLANKNDWEWIWNEEDSYEDSPYIVSTLKCRESYRRSAARSDHEPCIPPRVILAARKIVLCE